MDLFLYGNKIYQTIFAVTVEVLRLTHTFRKCFSLIFQRGVFSSLEPQNLLQVWQWRKDKGVEIGERAGLANIIEKTHNIMEKLFLLQITLLEEKLKQYCKVAYKIKVYPGQVHGFAQLKPEDMKPDDKPYIEEARKDMIDWLKMFIWQKHKVILGFNISVWFERRKQSRENYLVLKTVTNRKRNILI